MDKINVEKFNKVWLVYNRNSGKQIFASMMARVNEVFHQLRTLVGDETQIKMVDVKQFTEIDKIASEIVAEKVDWVIIAGGDGTIRFLIDKVVKQNYRPYFSIFPAGTVNLMGRELLLSVEPSKWIKRISKGLETTVYFGTANDQLFLTVAGIGYDSLIVDSVSEISKKFLSKFAYVLQGAKMMKKEFFQKNWKYDFLIRFDEEKDWHTASTVLVCKSRYYAGRYMLFHDASLKNNYFDVAMFTGKSSADFTRYLTLIGMEALNLDKSIIRRQAKKIEIKCNEKDFPVELDGDVITTVPLKIEMNSEPLRFIS